MVTGLWIWKFSFIYTFLHYIKVLVRGRFFHFFPFDGFNTFSLLLKKSLSIYEIGPKSVIIQFYSLRIFNLNWFSFFCLTPSAHLDFVPSNFFLSFFVIAKTKKNFGNFDTFIACSFSVNCFFKSVRKTIKMNESERKMQKDENKTHKNDGNESER